MAKARRPTKHEIEWRKIELAHEFRMFVAQVIGVILAILSFSIPLYVATLGIKALAGRETIISGDLGRVVAELIGGGCALTVIVAVLAKNQTQRSELRRLRERCKRLEVELEGTK